MKRKLLSAAICCIGLSNHLSAQISIAAVNTAYTQNFNSLQTGTGPYFQFQVPAGWTFLESGSGSDGGYTGDAPTNTTGNTFSFGTNSATPADRSFGGLRTGSLIPLIGASFTNNTGVTITSLSMSYTGKQWRLGTADANFDTLYFQYSTTAAGIGSGTFTNVSALHFSSPNNAFVGFLDGNLALNQTQKSFTITSLSIAIGNTFWIRWVDFDVTSFDDALGVDDFSITANPAMAVNDYYPLTGSTNLNNVANWTSNSNGTPGTAPANFSTAGDSFYVNGNVTNPQFNGVWTISGGAVVKVTNVNGILANTTPLVASLVVNAGSTVDLSGFPLILSSNANGTASVGNTLGTISNASNVTVQRYIPAKRAWRLLAASLQAATAPTIRAAWQEGGATPPGFGTWITYPSNVTGTTGYDAASNATSLQFYDGANLFTPMSTNITKVTDNGAAYFLFVRGDRTITGPGTPNNTTLRMTGTINQGNVMNAGVLGTTGFSLIPNPYPSPIDYEAVFNGNTGAAQQANFYMWDAQLGTIGSYRTVTRTAANTYTTTPAGGSTTANNSARYIQSGQAFFVNANTTMNFTESMKTIATPTFNVFKTTAGEEELAMNLSLIDNGIATVADGIRIQFDASYTNTPSAEDVVKLNNFNENISVHNNGGDYVIEKRAFVNGTEIVPLHFWNPAVRDYQLNFMPTNISATITASLVDAYTNTTTVINTTTNTDYNFSVTNDAASYDPNRFRIVFGNSTTNVANVAASATSGVIVYPNPLLGKTLHIAFNNMTKGAYEVQIINMVGSVVKTLKVNHDGGSIYTIGLPEQLAAGLYNVEVINTDNTKRFTQQLSIQ